MGTVIFLLIAGSYPFEGKNPVQVMQSIAKGAYSFPSDIKTSKTCMSLIQNLLQVATERRYSFADYFNHPFVKTEPKLYLAELRKIFGPAYGLHDPIIEVQEPVSSPPRHYEKSEILPPVAKKAEELLGSLLNSAIL